MAQLLPQLQSGGDSAPRRGARQVTQSANAVGQAAQRAAEAVQERSQG